MEELYPRTPRRFGGNGLLHDGSPNAQKVVGAATTHDPALVPDVTADARYLMVNPETRSELAMPRGKRESPQASMHAVAKTPPGTVPRGLCRHKNVILIVQKSDKLLLNADERWSR